MTEITEVNHYIKYIPPVYDNNNLFFNWHDTLYELSNNDRRFLSQVNGLIEQGTLGSAVNQQPLTENDLERVLDILEKTYYIRKELTDVVLMQSFDRFAELPLR